MPRNAPRAADRARAAVAARLRDLDWSRSETAQRAGISRNTLQSFLDGRMWPQDSTFASIEKALGWPAGHIAAILDEEEAPNIDGLDTVETYEDGRRFVLYFPPGFRDRYSEIEWEAILAAGRAASLRAALEIEAARAARPRPADDTP